MLLILFYIESIVDKAIKGQNQTSYPKNYLL